MDRAEVGVFEQGHEKRLGGLLQCAQGMGLEASIELPHVLGNLAHEALERELAQEEVGVALVAADLAECDGSRAVAVWLFDTACGGGGFARCPDGEEFGWGSPPGAPFGRLFGACHGFAGRGRESGVMFLLYRLCMFVCKFWNFLECSACLVVVVLGYVFDISLL